MIARCALGAFVLCVLNASASLGCADEDPPCFEGEYRRCACGDEQGYQRCENGAYGACDCESGTPGLSGSGGQGGQALLPLYAECETDEQCESGLCHAFAGGGRCTQACMEPEECPAPSTSCSMMGVCHPS